ncbi:MAG: hypothetical protein WCF33_22760 [Pseudonocardiaceae bacterium]
MSNILTTTSLHPGQAGKLAVLLDALTSVAALQCRACFPDLAGRIRDVHRGQHRGGDHPRPAGPGITPVPRFDRFSTEC